MKIEILSALSAHGVQRIQVTEKSFKDLEHQVKDMFQDKVEQLVTKGDSEKSISIFGIEVFTPVF